MYTGSEKTLFLLFSIFTRRDASNFASVFCIVVDFIILQYVLRTSYCKILKATVSDAERRIATFEDRGRFTINDGYDRAGLLRICKHFLGIDTITGLRDRAMFLFGHAMVFRGENTRGMILADVSHTTLYKRTSAEMDCLVLYTVVKFGKRNPEKKT